MKRILSCLLVVLITATQVNWVLAEDAETELTVVSTTPENGAGQITNIDTQQQLITIDFSEEIDGATVNSNTIIVSDAEGNNLHYDAYEISETSVYIEIGNLESDTEYTVTCVKDGVTTPDGIAIAEDYTFGFTTGNVIKTAYIPGKIITDVAAEKKVYNKNGNFSTDTVSYWEGYMTYDKTTVARMPVSGTGKGAVVDLGNYYDVVGVGIYAMDSDANPNEASFSGSMLFPDDENETILVQKTVCGRVNHQLYIQSNDDKQAHTVRYIELFKDTSANVYLRGLSVYAYVDIDYSEWTAKLNNKVKTNIDENGIYTLSLPIKSYGDYTDTSYVFMASYDMEGNIVSKYVRKIDVSGEGSYSVSQNFEVTDQIYAVKAFCSDNINISEAKTNVFSICRENHNQYTGELSEKLSYAYDDNKFNFYIKSDLYNSTDRLGYIVLKDDASFETVTESDVEYFDFLSLDKASGNMKFTYEAQSSGCYEMQFDCILLTGECEKVQKSFIKSSEEEKNEIINVFSNVQSIEQLKAALDTYVSEEKMFSLELVPEINVDIDEKVAQQYVYLLGTEIYGNIASISDIIRNLQMSYVISTFEVDAETAFSAKEKYKEIIDNGVLDISFINTSEKMKKFTEVYLVLKNKINDAESLVNTLMWTGVLANFKDSSPQVIADTITKYKELFDKDGELEKYMQSKISAQTGKSIELIEVTKLFDNKNVADYYGTETFATKFKEYVDSIEKKYTRPNKVVSNSGGGGGGISISTPVVTPTVKPPVSSTTPEVEIEKTSEMYFSDLEGFKWASEYIEKLYVAGCIDGVADKKFEPSRTVLREEFVKMCICAMNLNMQTATVSTFSDYKGTEWFVPYIQIAVSNKVVNGMDNGEFGIGMNITRQDMAVIIAKSMEAAGYVFTTMNETDFVDNSSIADYANNSIKKLYNLGVISGYEDNTFRPTASATRAEAAVMMYKAYEIINRVR